MKILVACEFSGIVREAFTKKGHDAWSCDLLPSEIEGKHIQDDVLLYLNDGWDLMIAHPPCQYLSVSGLHWNKRISGRGEKTEEALAFVYKLLNAPINKIALENPISCISTRICKPSQIIQPYEFGHPESKSTCLWLKNLPLLKSTNILPLPDSGRWLNQTPSGQNKLGPSPTRARDRSRTYQGIANAMADQWG
jgi:hypothetical protein